jgi:hypothetical protein
MLAVLRLQVLSDVWSVNGDDILVTASLALRTGREFPEVPIT